MRMNLLGMFPFTAPYLAWVFLILSAVLGSPLETDLVGASCFVVLCEGTYTRSCRFLGPRVGCCSKHGEMRGGGVMVSWCGSTRPSGDVNNTGGGHWRVRQSRDWGRWGQTGADGGAKSVCTCS